MSGGGNEARRLQLRNTTTISPCVGGGWSGHNERASGVKSASGLQFYHFSLIGKSSLGQNEKA